MENLAPPLELTTHLCFAIEKGQSLSAALKYYLSYCSDPDWKNQIIDWMQTADLKTPTRFKIKSPQRSALLYLVERGLHGEPIYDSLCEVQSELHELSRQEMETWVSALPLKALIPLLLFQFPAFVVLILGPILSCVVTN